MVDFDKPLMNDKARLKARLITLQLAYQGYRVPEAGSNPFAKFSEMGKREGFRPRTVTVEPEVVEVKTTVIGPVRRSSKVVVVKPATRKPHDGSVHCIKCDVQVRPGFCHTGRVLESATKIPIDVTKFDPSAMEDTTFKVKIPAGKYVHGHICDDCAGDYHSTHVEHRGDVIAYRNVIVDPLQSVPPRDQRDGFRSNKGFNTRITTG